MDGSWQVIISLWAAEVCKMKKKISRTKTHVKYKLVLRKFLWTSKKYTFLNDENGIHWHQKNPFIYSLCKCQRNYLFHYITGDQWYGTSVWKQCLNFSCFIGKKMDMNVNFCWLFAYSMFSKYIDTGIYQKLARITTVIFIFNLPL